MTLGGGFRAARERATFAVLGVLVIIGAGALAAANIDVAGGPMGGDATAVAGPPHPAPLTYRGRPPASLVPLGLTTSADPATADFEFEWGSPEGVVDREFVPVAALGTGVDSLSAGDLQGLIEGRLTNWRDVNGVPGGVTFVVAGPREDSDVVGTFTRGARPKQKFESYAALREQMGIFSGMVAFVPLDEVWPGATAIAIGGVDLVRGKGDPTNWPFTDRVLVRGLTDRGKDLAPRLQARIHLTLPKATTIVATGDILLSRCTLARIEAIGDWAAPFRGQVGDYLRGADLALGSLDGSIQDIGTPFGCEVTTNLTSPPQVLEALKLAGLDEVTIATNHVFDCGRQPCEDRAFLRTIDLLKQAGIKPVGGGRNLEEALAPGIFEVNGVKFGVLGFDDVAAQDLEATATEPGTSPLDDDYKEERAAGEPAFFRPAEELSLTRFSDRIRKLKREVDVVVVQVQSGTEDTHDPSPRSIKALRAAADAGADLIVGNQAHWVQAVETRPAAFIAYALGNLVFDQVQTAEHGEGYLLEATFWGSHLANVRLVPYRIVDRHHPEFLGGAPRAKVLGDVFAATRSLPPLK
jgi:poly-gamma-glutamate synthesis protein (capsule biosynthesis protein)